MEKLCFQENLTVCNRNYVGRNVCGNVTCLCFNDGKRGQRTAAAFGRKTSRTFKKTGMEIEYVARICFTARRSANQERKRTICYRVFGKIVINNKNVFTFIHKILAHRTTGIRSNILKRRGIGCGCRYDDGIVHCTVFIKCIYHIGNSRLFLTDRNVNTNNVFALLIDDRIRSNDGFTGLTVTDDKFSLTSTDRNHGVDRLDTSLERNRYGLSFNNTVCLSFDRAIFSCFDRTLCVNRLTQRIDNSADQFFTDGNGNDTTGTFHDTSLADTNIITKKNRADKGLLQVQRHTVSAVCKLKKLVRFALIDTMHLGNTVTDGDDVTNLILLGFIGIMFDLFFNNLADVI